MRLYDVPSDERGRGDQVGRVQADLNREEMQNRRTAWQRSAIVKPFFGLAFVVCMMAIWSLTAQAVTVISTDTRWTVANSPYRIQGDLIVNSGVTLTIEPGVEVRFAKVNVEEGLSNRAELLIEGKILAMGTADAPIHFVADTGTEEMGAWAGMILKGSGNKLSYVKVQHALVGVKVSGSVEILFSTIEKNLEKGVLLAKGGTLVLQGNEFAYNEVGLHCEGTAEIRENRFQSNSYGMLGIGVGHLVVTKNSFESNTYGIYLENGQAGNQILENLISGNDYGIYVDGGIPPRANHNDIYNNGVFDFFHQAKSDADARYNWWGTTNTGAIDLQIFDQNDNRSSVKYGYVDYSGFLGLSALAPTILNLTATPAAIRTGDMAVTVTFSKEMHTVVKPTITYGLLDPFTSYTVDPSKGKWVNYNQYQFTLHIPESMPEGQYRFRIAGAEALDGQLLKANIAYTFRVDRTPPKVFTGVDYFAISPNGDGRMDTLQAELSFNEPALLTYGIYQGQTLVYGPFTETQYLQTIIVSWNGKNQAGTRVTEGNYVLRVTVKDRAGNQSATPVDLPIVVDLTPPLLKLDPIPGIQMGDLTITGEVSDETETLTYLEYRRKGTTEWKRLSQVEGSIRGTLYNWVVSGLPDGAYELQAEAEDRAWNRTRVQQEIELDLNPPDAKILIPTADAHVAQSVTIMGQVSDVHLRSWKLEMETTSGWNPLASGVTPIEGEMARLNLTNYEDGDYRLRLRAEDQVGRVTEKVQTMNVDNATPPVIRGVSVSPQAFSPNQDGIKDQIQFLIYFSEVTHWQLTITHRSGQVVRSQNGSGAQLQWSWDGTRADGSRVADGDYSYRVTYVDQVNHPGVEETGTFTVDTVPPVLSVNPLPAITRETTLQLTGQVANFAQVEVMGQKIVVNNGVFTVPLQLSEGSNEIRVVASDLAGNQAVQTLPVVCDTTSPRVLLNPVKEVTNQAQVQVSGRIEDLNLSGAQVIVENELGRKESGLTLQPDQTFTINLNLTVGINTLIIQAVDKAGNLGEASCSVQYSPTVPEMYLIQPTVPYVSSGQVRVVLKILEGSEPLDPQSIIVDLDGQRQTHTWNASTKEVLLELNGLREGEHLLSAHVQNIKGESSGGIAQTLYVDLTDPTLTVDAPLEGALLDGWDGVVAIRGLAKDANLQGLRIGVSRAGGTEKVALTLDWRGQTQVQGTLAEWRVSEWANGRYTLKITVQDLAGREASLTRSIEIRNTGMISGRVRGDLEQLTDPLLLVANAVEIVDEVALDSLTGEFSQRVPTGDYLLALAPWGYDPVVLRPVQVKVGETLRNLDLVFESDRQLVLNGGKQLISLPLTLSGEPAGAGSGQITLKGWDGLTYYGLNEWVLLQPGRGYWVTGGTSLTLQGEPVARSEFRLPLTKGWNLIGSPYSYPYPVGSLRFLIDGRLYSFAEAVAAGQVDRGIWRYQNWYQQAGEFLPWQGYWIYVKGVGEVIFTPEQALYPYQRQNTMSLLSMDRIQAAEWKFSIRGMLGNASDVENIIGTAQGATNQFDAGLDLREPPGYLPYVSVYFPDPSGEMLTASYQEPLDGAGSERSWEMIFDSPESGTARLQWDLDPDATVHLSLRDVVTGKEIDMLAQANYSFQHRGGELRKFILTAEKHGFEIKRVHNYPNPFSAVPLTQGKEPGTRIRYLLTANASVEVTIYDVVGRSVKRFPLMEIGKPGGMEGWNELYWDGKNGRGEPVANGVYLVQIKARYGKKYYVKTGRMATINGR